MPRKETRKERAAWSKHFGLETKEPSKYSNEKTGKYASKHESEVAANLAALEKSGAIFNLKEQVSFTLLESRNGVRSIRYVADFVWDTPDGNNHIGDAKGFRHNRVWELKRKMMKLLLGLDIEEL
jgi:hypothetical protein